MNAHQDPVHCTPFLDLPFLERDVATEERADGSLLMRSRVPLGTVEAHLPAVLRRHAQSRPDRHWLLQRREGYADWLGLTYGQAGAQVDAVTPRQQPEHGLQQVVAIGPPAGDLQCEIEFGGGRPRGPAFFGGKQAHCGAICH